MFSKQKNRFFSSSSFLSTDNSDEPEKTQKTDKWFYRLDKNYYDIDEVTDNIMQHQKQVVSHSNTKGTERVNTCHNVVQHTKDWANDLNRKAYNEQNNTEDRKIYNDLDNQVLKTSNESINKQINFLSLAEKVISEADDKEGAPLIDYIDPSLKEDLEDLIEKRVSLESSLKQAYNEMENSSQEESKSAQDLSAEENTKQETELSEKESLNETPQEEKQQDKTEKRSIIDDFADPSTEMPSYMDPED